jgi:two-component system nitrate/nitrite response regulator NarL
MSHKLRVAVVDEHPLYRDGIIFTLAMQSDIEVVGQGGTAQDALRIAEKDHPDVIILSMTAQGNSMSSLEKIASLSPNVRILALVPVPDAEQACAILRLGVRGYSNREISGSDLIQILRTLSRDESYVPSSLAARVLLRYGPGGSRESKNTDRFSELSLREEQILASLVCGLSNKEIAIKLNLSEKTVKHHVTNILKKLQVRNRVEAAILSSGRTAALGLLPKVA